MKKILFTFLFMMLGFTSLYSQRVVFQSDFENITLNSDSLPQGWTRFDVDGHNPAIKWAVRDTSVNFGGTTRPRAIGRKSLEIPWYAGNGGNNVNDDWVYTDSFTVRTGDSLIFSMLLGSDTTFQPYLDSMQVLISVFNDPNIPAIKLATIKSNDSAGHPLNNNVWTIHRFNLSAYNGQKMYLAFRYYMNISVDGLWCNIDNIFIGNHSAIGITPISTNVPKEYALKQNYPNPFNPATNINFDLPHPGFVNLVVFNMLGQQVATLVKQDLKAGSYKVDWNAQDLPSGTYFYKITAGTYVKTNKMILVK